MIELQVINKILSTGNDDIIKTYNITDEYFTEYAEEWKFIKEHKNNYGNIPDVESFLDKFSDFDIIQVNESDEYLAKTFEEEHLYSKSIPILKKVDDLYEYASRINSSINAYEKI